jgi:hypothetical protein
LACICECGRGKISNTIESSVHTLASTRSAHAPSQTLLTLACCTDPEVLLVVCITCTMQLADHGSRWAGGDHVWAGGSCRYPSGATYEGEWRDNLKDGRGVYYFPKGGTYEGEWSRG